MVRTAAQSHAICSVFLLKSSGATLQRFKEKRRSRSACQEFDHQKANFWVIVVTDVNSPNFDLEKFLEKISKESP